MVGNLTLVRCTPRAVYRLRDDELVTHTAAGKRTERLEGDAAFRRAAGEVARRTPLPVERPGGAGRDQAPGPGLCLTAARCRTGGAPRALFFTHGDVRPLGVDAGRSPR